MDFFHVHPIEKATSSRWFVDEITLSALEHHYRNYPLDKNDRDNPDNVVDRWHEFKADKLDEFYFDFGGMWNENEPEISKKIYGINFKSKVTQMPFVIEVLKGKRYYRDKWDAWFFGMYYWKVVFSPRTRHRILEVFKPLLPLFEEMIEGYTKDHERFCREAGIMIMKRKENDAK